MFAKSFLENHPVDLSIESTRKSLAKLLMKLFDHWQLDVSTQLNLLGLSSNSRAMLSKFRQGHYAIPNSRDALDRAGWLLAIHKALRLLYPKNEKLCYTWITRRNNFLNNLSPLDIMKEQGIIGLAKISRYLDNLRGT